MVSGGEALAPELARRLLPHARALWNQYGPSETTIYSTQHRVREADGASVPIGLPLPNTRVYVVDAQLQPVPPGVPGELLIGGDGLARGYFRRPELTAERFLADAWSGVPGARLFRTGDRARWRTDGTLEYLGRLDHQVKLRGYRIELGEIEAVLELHAGVQQAVVTVHGAGEDARLVAYVVPRPGGAPDDAELRAHLKQRLPEFMLPEAVVRLERVPLSPNGKVDRRALPEPARPAAGARRAPRDEYELRLARVWERVLGGGPVGVDDDFWERGGHSLKAVQLQAAVRAEFGRTLPLALLVQRPTVAQMAAELRSAALGVERPTLVALRAEGSRAPLVALHPVGGEVLCYADLARRLGPEQPFHAFQAPHAAAALATLEDLAQHYLGELRRVRSRGPYHLLGWSFGGLLAFELARQLTAAGDEVGLLALVDALPPGAQPGLRDAAASFWALLVDDVEGLFDVRLGLDPADLARAGEVEALARLHAALGAHGRLPEGLGLDALRAQVRTYRRHLEALLRYEPRPWPGRALLVSGRDAAAVAGGDAAAPWRALVTGGIEHVTLPASHYELLAGESAARLADLLGARLPAKREEVSR
jgi:thioesterase domain-containing protein